MIFENLTKKFYINSIIIFSIFFADRLSKIYVVDIASKNYSSELFKSKFLNINLIWNEGIAFGLFSFEEKNLYNILTLIISLVVLIILFMMVKSEGIKRYSLIMILGGALGNLYDRIFYKGVPDFIDFHVGNFHWFIFNVSDIFITLGVISMVVFELIDNKGNNDNEKT